MEVLVGIPDEHLLLWPLFSPSRPSTVSRHPLVGGNAAYLPALSAHGTQYALAQFGGDEHDQCQTDAFEPCSGA